MSEVLKNKVEEWVNSQGFPFEMFVAKTFKMAGFNVGQSVFYTDEVNDVGREIDIIAFNSIIIQNTTFSIAVVIECKTSKAKPWIAFKSNFDIDTPKILKSIYSTKEGANLLTDLAIDEKLDDFYFFNVDNNESCYSLVQAFTNGNEVSFASESGLLKCIKYNVNKFNKTSKFPFDNRAAYIYIPCIIIDTQLFTCEIDENNTSIIKEVQEVKHIVRRQESNQLYSIFSIITKEFVADFAEKLFSQTNLFFETYRTQLETIAAKKSSNWL